MAIGASCRTGGAADAARPKQLTYEDAVGAEACKNPNEDAQPMIVDWPLEKRTDLEAALKQGVAVAKYDCKRFELLSKCGLAGSYGFIGTTRREQVIRLSNADEVKANLPIGGPLLAKQIGAELGRSTSLDVALVMVGKLSSSRPWVGRDELPSECAGATHFVRRATVGAFAMSSTSGAKVEVAATIFANVKSSSSKSVKNTDGKLSECEKSSTKATEPPDQCGAPLRLELLGISAKSLGDIKEARGIDAGCPDGFKLMDGACRAPVAGKPHLCDPLDHKDCTKQCDAGNAESCVNLAFQYDGGMFGPNGEELVVEDESMARDMLIKACDLGSAEGCGYVMSQFRASPTAPDKAVGVITSACDGGDSRACWFLGSILVEGLAGVTADPKAGYKALKRGCDGGQIDACSQAAPAFASGKDIDKDPLAAATMWIRTCEAGSVEACRQAARSFEKGEGVAKDPKRAKEMQRRGCEQGKRVAVKVDDLCK